MSKSEPKLIFFKANNNNTTQEPNYKHLLKLNLGLHLNILNTNANDGCRGEAEHTVHFVYGLAFAKASIRPYINVLNANSL